MTVKQLKDEIEKFGDDVEVLTKKTELVGNALRALPASPKRGCQVWGWMGLPLRYQQLLFGGNRILFLLRGV